MKMSASEYYSLPTIRKVRRMIRTQARKWTITINNKGNRKSKDRMKAKLKLFDNKGVNVLKARKYKRRIKISLSYGDR